MTQEKKFEFHITQEFSGENIAGIKLKIDTNYHPYQISKIFYEIMKKDENFKLAIVLAVYFINNEEKENI